MELGVLALMFAPSYQLISCGSRDRGPNSLSLLPLLSGVVLILSPLSFYVILTQKFTFFYQRQIFNAADDFVHNLNAMAVHCTVYFYHI